MSGKRFQLFQSRIKRKYSDKRITQTLRNHSLIVLRWRGDLVLGVSSSVADDRAVDQFGVGAVLAVPGVAAFEPRQLIGHGGEQVVEGPGNDDVVVETDVQGYDDHSVADTWGAGVIISKNGMMKLLNAYSAYTHLKLSYVKFSGTYLVICILSSEALLTCQHISSPLYSFIRP